MDPIPETTWFFETFVLAQNSAGYRVTVGERHARGCQFSGLRLTHDASQPRT
ncbi:MAG TPA: hypothetical protein VJT77_00620 [Burkholderiales bacterium]|nr:hypothetical protein [Burkholderiales bacterium]